MTNKYPSASMKIQKLAFTSGNLIYTLSKYFLYAPIEMNTEIFKQSTSRKLHCLQMRNLCQNNETPILSPKLHHCFPLYFLKISTQNSLYFLNENNTAWNPISPPSSSRTYQPRVIERTVRKIDFLQAGFDKCRVTCCRPIANRQSHYHNRITKGTY